MRGATTITPITKPCSVFQSTRPLRGATRPRCHSSRHPSISIHAPLAGRDAQGLDQCRPARHFNPRAPCGARPEPTGTPIFNTRFQSTRPLRGATARQKRARRGSKFQSTRPLRGATRLSVTLWQCLTAFQSTRPLRGATPSRPGRRYLTRDFNPRAPCGARLLLFQWAEVRADFNPRAPCGARRRDILPCGEVIHISIHAPLAGRDKMLAIMDGQQRGFQSTRPLRGATDIALATDKNQAFQSTRPLRGATTITGRSNALDVLFQSTRPLRGATRRLRRCHP